MPFPLPLLSSDRILAGWKSLSYKLLDVLGGTEGIITICFLSSYTQPLASVFWKLSQDVG